MADLIGELIGKLNPLAAGNGPIGRGFGQIGNLIVPNEVLTKEEIIDIYLKKEDTKDEFPLAELMRFAGFDVNGWEYDKFRFTEKRRKLVRTRVELPNATPQQGWVYAQQSLPSVMEIIALLNRDLISEPLATRMLSMLGYKDTNIRDLMMQFRFQYPSPSDLIRYSVREAFDPAVIKQYGYHKEFPIQVLPFMKIAGYHTPMGFARPEGATDLNGEAMTGEVTPADLEWYSHWDVPSNTQGYTMLHMLYSDSRFGPSPLANQDTYFNPVDLDTLQKVNDIPAYWRRRLQAISYHPLTRVDIRRMYELGVLTDGEVYHSFRAGGYNDLNANNMLQFYKRLREKALSKQGSGIRPQTIRKNYILGIITKEQADSYLKKWYPNDSDRNNAITSWDLDRQSQRIDKKIKQLHRAFTNGFINIEDVATIMREMNLDSSAIEQYTDEWRFEQRYHFKDIKTTELIKWFREGILDESELRRRLQNIGVIGVDIQRMIGIALLEMEKKKYVREKQIIKESKPTKTPRIRAREVKARLIHENNEKLLKILVRDRFTGPIYLQYFNGSIDKDSAIKLLGFDSELSDSDKNKLFEHGYNIFLEYNRGTLS